MSDKKTFGDVVFIFQITLSLILCGTQVVRAFESTQGMSLSMQWTVEGFLFLHFLLALGAYYANPSRVTYQTMVVYTFYGGLTALLLGVIHTREGYHWGDNDNQTMLIAGVGVGVTILVMWVMNISFKHPIPKSFLAISFKSIPQLMMAWKIGTEGGAGIHGAAVLVGHFSILIRITQISIGIKRNGWEENATWLLVSEVVNELSWIAVTIAWLSWISST